MNYYYTRTHIHIVYHTHYQKNEGIVDVDVYGPSLPVLIKPDDPAVRRSPLGVGMVKPIEHEGVKMISLGFVSPTVRV